MSESTLKPFTGKLDENIDTNQQPALKPFTGALDGEKKGVIGHLKDTGLSALKGAVAVPELAVGIMDVMSDGATGKILENKNGTVGFRPKEAKQALGNLHTDQYKAQQQEFADAGKDGNWVDKVVDKTKVALRNPSLIANTVVESVPSMLAGGALGRASGIANPVVAGAVGEGAVMAGSQAEQIRQQTVDGRLTADQSLAGVGTGALGGLIGFAGGRLAQKMGIGDVDTMLVTGRAGPAEIAGEIASMPAKSLPRRVIEGAISEGFLEELPQTVSEQVIQNLALDKPWHDGIEDAAVMGTLAGMAMGGAANILSGRNTGTESQDNQQQSGSPNLPSAPPQLGSSPDNALTGEYIPREDVSQGGNQGRTAFVYDQPSMDADNLLNNNGFDYGSAATGNPVSPDTPPAPNGNYFDGDYGSEAAFDDLLNSVPPASQTPSQQMGINPNDGPMSSAAALAVDSGASPVTPQLGYTPDQSNTQADNAGESISQQYDLNAVDAIGGGIETDRAKTTTAQTVQPILGQDGKNKWFGTQDKAQAFIDKKNLGNDYQVVQDGKRFEIQPKKLQSASQNVDTLPKTESSNQDDVPNPYNENKLRAQVRDLSLQASKEAQANNAEDSKYIANLGNTASARSNEKVKEQLPDLYKRAEELAKTAEITSAGRRGNTHFSSLSFKGDSSFVSGDAWPKRPTKDEVLQQAIWHLSQDDKNGTPKNVQSALQLTELEKQFKNEKSVAKKAQIRKQITELQNGLTEQAQSSVSLNQPQKTTVENLSGEFKKIEESTTRINAARQRMREANPEIFTAENDRVRETHGLTNARVTSIADEIETSGSYELSDREYEKIKNNPNYKIDYDARNFMGKVTAVKDPHSGEWVGNNEQSDLDNAAHEAATSVQNDLPAPTQAQIEAGNYKKGHIKVNNLDIAVENPQGSERSGTDPDGKPWSHTMSNHYGYIKGTKGADQEHIDTYVGENPDSDQVFVVDQIDQASGGFDEHKVMLGFDSQEAAVAAYQSNFDKGWKTGPVKRMTMDEFKTWIKTGDTTKPVNAPEQKTESQHPVNKWQEEMNKALEKADPEHPLFKKLQASAKNGLRSVSDRAVALRQAREIEKKADAPKAEVPKVEPEQPKVKVSENKFVTDERRAELEKRIKAKLSQLNSGVDPELIVLGTELALYHIERGVRTFAAYAKAMTESLGDSSKPFLKSWYMGVKYDPRASGFDGMSSAAEVENFDVDGTLTDEGTMTGKTETVVTPAGREFEVQHKVVEAADLITSNLDSGAINSEYPQALQPRDRTTLKSVTQVNDIANKLNPKLLGDSASSTNGAPIVSPGNEVESGNGRTLAIRKAYQIGKADAYKAWLAEQGYDVDNMQQPVLVRERITPMNMAERVAYTTESNERDTLDMSPSEQAMSDAPKVMDILHLVQGGSFNNTANRDFVNAFLTGVASKNERGTMLDKDGVSLTQDGYRRIESALLAAAFNDAQIISQVIESKDSDIKAIGNALIEAAPQWAQVRKGVQDGILVEGVNVEANLVEAVHLVRKARQQNLSLSEMLNQDDIFDGSIDQVTKDFISIFYSGDKLNKARSSQKVADALKSYAQLAMTAKASPNLFGDAPLSNEQILGQVNDRLKQSEAEKQQDIFTSPQSNEPDAGTVGGGRSGRGTGPRSETAQEQSEPTKALKKTAPTSEKETIQDFGEKIGGARKDTSVKTGPKTSGTTTKDNRPTWAKRFEITEIAASSNPNEVGKWIITDTRKKDWKGNAKQLGKQFFDSQKDAELALPILAVAQKHRVWAAGKDSFSIYREISDRKRVKVVEQEFQTREDAMKYMAIHAIEILETNTTFGEIDLPRPENTVRKGLDRRKGDAKDADFIRVFGFRGVEFGNWNNQAERQELLNDAFDGLMDLAEILNIPPAAISLNGELALAFGARGQGLSGAKAHYEPERAVINLTKLNGAGSLAHEWWHALDHYFGRQDGKAPSEWVTNADGSRSLKIAKHFEDMSVTSGFSYKSNVREDVQEAYKQLVQTIFRKSENYIDDTVKVESFVSSARNNLKDQLDKLRADLNRELDPKYYKRFNKAASAEQLAEFDTVAELLLTGTALTTEIRHNNNKNSRNIFSGARWSNDALDKLSVIYKSVRGRSGFNAEQKGVLDRLRQYMNTYAQRLKLLAEAQNGTEKAKMIPTDFAMNAKELDQGRGTDYWITTPEMTARAFQGYVEDKISQNSGYSPFLNFGPESAAIFTPWGFKRPFPTGTERKAINAKFSDLVDTLKTEETETGIKLYSRDKLKPDNERRGASPLDTTFTPLSVVSATRRVLSILQHLKMSATQDASSRGRINVSLNNRIGVNKVGNVNSNGFSVQVISSFSDLPKVIQNDATYKDENGKTQNYDVSGVWHDGTLYVVADQVYGDSNKQLTTFDVYEELLTHEIVGHFGVQKLFGNEYKTKFQQLFNALGKLEGIRKIAKDNGVDMNQFDNAYIKPFKNGVEEGYYDPLDAQQATVSELFAFVAQNAKSRPFVRQKLKEVIGYIRQWFRDRGFDKFLSRYNDADLMMFLSEARKAVVDRSYFGKYKNQEFSSKNNSDTPLYSRRTKSNLGSTTQQVRDVLIDRFGKETIDELERQGKLEIIQDYQVEGVEGFYYNGKAVLVASNLTAESTVPTFLHELGGHAGFQNMMNQKQYNELMNQFNKLVEQGNPVALAAKMLAEREQGSERQHLEYLPYLLTLSSTMEQRNVLQRNALQKLINNLVTYVKATLFDNFGINLNLNPNDIVALAERMIEKSSYNAENTTSPLYSRQFFDNTINNLSESIKNLSVKSIKDKADDRKIDWLGIGLSALGRRQLTEIYSKLLPQLNKYNDLAAQMDSDKNDAGAKADSIVREWANLKDEEALADVMHDSTLAKIDPTKPHVKGDSISKYKQLRDAYNSLSPEAQAMYLKARDAYKKHYAEVHQAIKERILRSELSNQKKADLLKQMDDNFFGQIKGVYFPLARFGKYIVLMRNQNGDVESVSRAETMGEAQSLRSELMKKYPDFIVNDVEKSAKFNSSRDSVGRGFMSNLFDEVSNLGLDAKTQAEFEDTLSQLYLSSMPDLSWAKHGIHRKGTAGFSQDARRAFAQNMFHGAAYLAKLRYGDQLAQQLDEMKKYSKEQFNKGIGYDQPTAQSVIDEMEERHKNLMNPVSSPLSSALTSLGFIYYLGLSPAAAMVNLSQTALVAYPIMGAKWGFDKAANELLKTSNDFRKGVEFHKVKWEGTKTDLYKAVSSDISKFLNKDEKQAYEDAVARGVIDVTQAHDLAGIAQGEDSGVMWKTRPIMRAASVMFHSAERFNREVTFIAAYRLARQSGENHDSAFDQAVDATYKGHFDYSSGNRPRIMQGNVAKVLLLFKQFGQNMLYTLARQTYQSIKGETEAERKEARKSLGAILAMHATFAGALGLPMVGMLLSVASWMGGDDDEPWDAEVALRNYLAEAFNPTISNMLMKGAPRGIGVDISSRVGINNLLLPDVQEGLEGKKWWDSAASAALGPIGGIGANIAKGAQEISEGHNLRGVESMLPVFLKNFAKTYRYADEGVQDKTGVSIMDEVSSMDLLVQGMGFSPSDVRTASEGKTAIYQLNRKLNERRSRLMALWSRAKMMDDQQEMDEIWEQIQGFNDKNPSRRITRMNLNQSYRNRQRRIDRAEDGIYLSRNRQDAREAGYFAFGE
ncbi:PLxRFG domain-containing protein [Acinetobacter sp. 102]|uniref:PLxRFG domain-containing protein n=1 Tax=Acinetobacter sp. 102 TaxID=3098766 RepID=UPI00300AC2F0